MSKKQIFMAAAVIHLLILLFSGLVFPFGEEDGSFRELLERQSGPLAPPETTQETPDKDLPDQAYGNPELERVLALYEAYIETDVLNAGRYLSLYEEFAKDSPYVDEKKEYLAKKFGDFLKKENLSSPLFTLVSDDCESGFKAYIYNDYMKANEYFGKVRKNLPSYGRIIELISRSEDRDREIRRFRTRIEASLKGLPVDTALPGDPADASSGKGEITAFEQSNIYLLEGYRLLEEEKPLDALQKFMEAKRCDTDNLETLPYIDIAALMIKRQNETRLRNQKIEALLYEALAAGQRGDLKAAAAKYREVLSFDPGNGPAAEKAEELAFKIEDINKSEELEGYIKKAGAAYGKRDIRDAVINIKKAYAIAPKYTKVLELAGLYR